MKKYLIMLSIVGLVGDLQCMNKALDHNEAPAVDEQSEASLLKKIAIGDLEAHYDLGYLHYEKREYQKAKVLFEKAAHKFGEASYMLAIIADEQGHKDEAAGFYEKAAEKKVKEAQLVVAKNYDSQGDKARALEFYTAAASQGCWESSRYLAIIYEEIGDYKQADVYYANAKKQYIETNEKERSTHTWAKYAGIEELEKLAKKARTGNAQAFHDLGFFLINEPNSDRALSFFLGAVKRGHTQSLSYIAKIYKRKDALSKACEYFERAIVEANDFEASFELGVLIQKDNPERAFTLFKTAARNRVFAAQRHLQRTFQARKDSQQMLELYVVATADLQKELLQSLESWVAELSEDALSAQAQEMRYYLARCYEYESDKELKISENARLQERYHTKALQEKTQKSTQSSSTSRNLDDKPDKRAEQYEQEAQAHRLKALELSELAKKQYLHIAAGHREAKDRLFKKYLENEEFAKARALFLQDDFYSLNRLGEVLLKEGNRTEARVLFARAAQAGHKEAQYNLAQDYVHRTMQCATVEEVNELLVEAEQLFLASALQDYAEAQYQIGQIRCREGKIVQAQEWFEKAAAQDHAQALCKLASMLKNKGDKKAATQCFKRSADLGNVWALYHLGRCAQEDARPGEDFFRRAARCGHQVSLHVLKDLQAKGHTGALRELDEVQYERMSLFDIVEYGDEKAVKIYLEKIQEDAGNLAWFESVNDSYYDTDKSLRRQLTDQEILTGDTFLHRAVKSFNLSTLKGLLADDIIAKVQGPGKSYINLQNLGGKTCLDLAQDFGFREFIELITSKQRRKKKS